jgi:hypothetical protein
VHTVSVIVLYLAGVVSLTAQTPILPGRVPMLDAHNCYPYEGLWKDRIDRALSTGFPVGIEQDMAWVGQRSVVAHDNEPRGGEPGLEQYFFERVRPLVLKALKENDKRHWPLIVLHFDFKDNSPDNLRAVWKVLGKYESWITTGRKTARDSAISALHVKPILVLTEDNDTQEQVFYRDVPRGAKLRLFGSAKVDESFLAGLDKEQRKSALASVAPERLVSHPPTNYRRWWNNSWYVVERGGAPGAGEWTAQTEARLQSLVNYAHGLGYWIRFYTLDGFPADQDQGWGPGYNFGSLERARQRWQAAVRAGVDLIASDQYEELRTTLPGNP